MANDGEMKIEKGIPLAARTCGRGVTHKYPFRQMKIGDSFLVAGAYSEKLCTRVSNAACVTAKRIGNGRRFSTRRVKDGIRVWRIA